MLAYSLTQLQWRCISKGLKQRKGFPDGSPDLILGVIPAAFSYSEQANASGIT